MTLIINLYAWGRKLCSGRLKFMNVPDAIRKEDSYRLKGIRKGISLAKHKYGYGLITSRLDQTTRSTIALSVIAMNGIGYVDPLSAYFSISFYQGTNCMNLCWYL